MKKPESICVFGDSTAWGAWDTEAGGWVNRLWLQLARGSESDDYCELYNLSVSGGTTQTILERFESEARIRNAEALIFQTGGNDAAEDQEGNALIPLEMFESNLEQIITAAQTITDRIIFMSCKDVDETRSLPVPWADVYYRNVNVETYNNSLRARCDKRGVLFLELPELGPDDFADGVHPNVIGHQKIFNQVLAFLKQHHWV